MTGVQTCALPILVRAFHDEMSTLEEEAVNMQKQFAEDILVKTQLVTKIVIKF